MCNLYFNILHLQMFIVWFQMLRRHVLLLCVHLLSINMQNVFAGKLKQIQWWRSNRYTVFKMSYHGFNCYTLLIMWYT